MTILWRLGGGTVHAVIAELPPGRSLAYTSVSTMLRILEHKRFVCSRKTEAGRGHVYVPAVAKAEYELTAIRQVVGRVFDGAAVSLVRRLVEEDALTQEELDAMREIIRKAAR